MYDTNPVTCFMALFCKWPSLLISKVQKPNSQDFQSCEILLSATYITTAAEHLNRTVSRWAERYLPYSFSISRGPLGSLNAAVFAWAILSSCTFEPWRFRRGTALVSHWRFQRMPSNGEEFSRWLDRSAHFVRQRVWKFGIDFGIRASVDALCGDGTSDISRDPRTKRLETRRGWLAMPSKHTKNHSRVHIYLYICPKVPYVPAILDTRNRSYAISQFSCHHILLLLLL